MKLLAIDWGLKRLGLAVSDPEGKLAFPYKTIYKTTRDRLFAEIAEVVDKESIQGLVVGLPVSRGGDGATDGSEPSLSARQAKNFAESLERRFPLPVHLVDETLTSYEAEQMLRERGLHGKKLKQLLDQYAAVRILETFLSSGPSREEES